MAREVQAPTKDKHGADVHPAFGKIEVSRISATPGEVLFDSDVRHGHFVRITVRGARRQRDLNRDWISDDSKALIEIDLSEAQFASFVASMNTTGVPATLRRTVADHQIPGLEYDPRLAHSMAEARGAARAMMKDIAAAMQVVSELDPKATAKEKRAAMDALRAAVANAAPNVEFASKQLAKHSEDVVQRARADVEAIVTQKAVQLGMTAGQATGLVALPSGLGKQPALPEPRGGDPVVTAVHKARAIEALDAAGFTRSMAQEQIVARAIAQAYVDGVDAGTFDTMERRNQ